MTILRKRGVYKGDFPRREDFIRGVHACLALARDTYPEFKLSDSDIPIVFFPKGGAAGKARWKFEDYKVSVWNLEFNVDGIDRYFDKMFYDTIPHEVAHIVNRYVNGHDNIKPHGPEWRSIARKLGSNGRVYHSMKLTGVSNPRKIRPGERYVTDSGHRVYLGPTQHRRLQDGRVYRYVVGSTGERVAAHNHSPS